MAYPECHEVKIWPEYFEQIINGNKPFEIRRDDRCYQKGDIVTFREFNRGPCRPGVESSYSGRTVTAEIGCVTAFKQQPGYVVFSLINIDR